MFPLCIMSHWCKSITPSNQSQNRDCWTRRNTEWQQGWGKTGKDVSGLATFRMQRSNNVRTRCTFFRSNHSFTTVKTAITYRKCIYSAFLYGLVWGRELQTKLSALCFATSTANPLTKFDVSVNIYWETEPSLTDLPNPDSHFGADLLLDKWCVIQPTELICTTIILNARFNCQQAHASTLFAGCICFIWYDEGKWPRCGWFLLFSTHMNNICISFPSTFQEDFYHSSDGWHFVLNRREDRTILSLFQLQKQRWLCGFWLHQQLWVEMGWATLSLALVILEMVPETPWRIISLHTPAGNFVLPQQPLQKGKGRRVTKKVYWSYPRLIVRIKVDH